MRVIGIALLSLALLQGCKKTEKNGDPAAKQAAAKNAGPSKVAQNIGKGAKEAEPHASPLPWIHDDYATALEQAKLSKKPLVIDMWAPWCHTCLSMKHYILSDKSFSRYADRFIWLAIDTDKEANEALMSKLEVNVWPTFYVLAPADESIQARHLGSASIKQFREFLARGEAGALNSETISGPLASLRDAERAMAKNDYKAADVAFRAALKEGGPEWPRRSEALASHVFALYLAQSWDACTDLGLAHLEDAAHAKSASAFDFASFAVNCAKEIMDEEKQSKMFTAVTADDGPMVKLLADDSAELSVDDRSDALRIMRNAEIARKRGEQALSYAKQQKALLDKAVADAPNAFIKMTYIWPRAEVYTYLEQPGALVAEFQELAKALPDQYEPPYRLAWIYLQAKDLDKALVQIDIALKKMYGPRKASGFRLLASIHAARGEADKEKDALAKAEAISQ